MNVFQTLNQLSQTSGNVGDVAYTLEKKRVYFFSEGGEVIDNDLCLSTPSGGATRWVVQDYDYLAAIKNVARSENNTRSTTSSIIPLDNTKPQKTEGTQILSVTHTPTKIGNKVRVRVVVYVAKAVTEAFTTVALFSGGSDAIATAYAFDSSGTSSYYAQSVMIDYMSDVSSLSSVTYTVRAGGHAGPVEINGYNGAKYDGALISSITVEEIPQ